MQINQNACSSRPVLDSHALFTNFQLPMILGRSLIRPLNSSWFSANFSVVLASKPKSYKRHISVAAMSASPPPTPPSRAPGDQERRFKEITSPCEWIEDYHPGGFHPVHLGDFFNDGQFKVIRKLGDGAYSTVWLAHDLRLADSHHSAR
jgi:hypothetical protein